MSTVPVPAMPSARALVPERKPAAAARVAFRSLLLRDLVVLDNRMPGLSGLDALAKIREFDRQSFG